MLSIASQKRKELFQKMDLNSVAIIPSANIVYRSNDVKYPFRQNSDFFYLTAFQEPNSIAIFIKNSNELLENEFILLHQRLDHIHTIWEGGLASPELIKELFGADQVYYLDQIEDCLPKLLLGKETVYWINHGDRLGFNKYYLKVIKYLAKMHNANNKIVYKDLLTIIHELRIFKSSLELEKIRYATKVSCAAHQYIIKYVATNKNLTEKHVYAEFYNYCLQHGCDDMAYNPIIAVGNNACILHYSKKESVLKPGELLLIDAGGEYGYYAADITRVFPINGKFSDQQKAIYNLVLLAQKQAIKKAKPGQIWSNIQQEIIEVLVEGLIELKILHGKRTDLIESAAYKDFYMHNSGHFLGLDVHDVGSYKVDGNFRPLAAGMVITVEPGLYFPNNCKAPKMWHGIGIRIEDNILINQGGNENLTTSAVKEIDEIEDLMLN